MAAAAKEAAIRIAASAKQQRVRFPLTWDDNQIRQAIGASLMINRLEDGSFDDHAVINALIEKFGQTEDPNQAKNTSSSKKRAAEDESDDDDDHDDSDGEEELEEGKKRKKRAPKESKPKIKKTEIVENEANRAIAAAIKEIGDIHFQNKDTRKGFVFSKGAKALRECPTAVTTKKEAMALPGVGAGIAGYIVEFLTSGSISKLEEMRAGTA